MASLIFTPSVSAIDDFFNSYTNTKEVGDIEAAKERRKKIAELSEKKRVMKAAFSVSDERHTKDGVANHVASLKTVHQQMKTLKTANKDVMDADGIEKFCMDIGIDMESDIVILIIAWKCKATTMGCFTREEFRRGMSSIGCTSIPSLTAKLSSLRQEIKQEWTSFQQMYIFCFSFATSAEVDAIDAIDADVQELLPFDSAVGYWTLLWSDSWMNDYLEPWIEYSTQTTLCDDGIPKNVWVQLLEIVRFKELHSVEKKQLGVLNSKDERLTALAAVQAVESDFLPVITNFLLFLQHKKTRDQRGPGVMVVMRHSVRLDDDPTAVWEDRMLRPYDTPIKDFNLPVLQANKLYQNYKHFDTIIVSPFRRCLQTAAIVVKTLHDLFPQNPLPRIHINKKFGEAVASVRSCQRHVWEENKQADGKVVYLNEEEMLQLLNVHSNGVITNFNGPIEGDAPNPKETHQEGIQRFRAALSEVGEKQCRTDGKYVLVVAHAGTVDGAFRTFTSTQCYSAEECCFAAFSFQGEYETAQIAKSRVECL